MQKFREYIYVDNEKIVSYTNQIKDLNKRTISQNSENTSNIDGTINAGLAKAEANTQVKNSTTYSLNNSLLELFIEWANNKNNVINYEGKKLNQNNISELIVISGKMNIPEMSENLEIINSLTKETPLLNAVSISDEDKKILSYMKESDNIPILLETNSNYVFNFNLKRNNLDFNKNDLFDNLDENVIIIGRIDKIYDNDENIEIFDIAKEIFKINRAIRRKMPQETLEKAILTENGPLIKITPLIIYK